MEAAAPRSEPAERLELVEAVGRLWAAAPHWAAEAGIEHWVGSPPRPAGRELVLPALGRNRLSPAGAAGVDTEYRAAPVWSGSKPAVAVVVVADGAVVVVAEVAVVVVAVVALLPAD